MAPPGRRPWGQGPSATAARRSREIIRRVRRPLANDTRRIGRGGKGLGNRGALFVLLAALLLCCLGTSMVNRAGHQSCSAATGKTAAGLNAIGPRPIGSVIRFRSGITRSPKSAIAVSAERGHSEGQMLTGTRISSTFISELADRPAKPKTTCSTFLIRARRSRP